MHAMSMSMYELPMPHESITQGKSHPEARAFRVPARRCSTSPRNTAPYHELQTESVCVNATRRYNPAPKKAWMRSWQHTRTMSPSARDGGIPAYETTDDTAPPNDQSHFALSEDLYTSRHNPDFRTRNHDKIVRIQTILSTFTTQLSAIRLAKDHDAFDDLYQRIITASQGFQPLQQPRGSWVELKAPDEDEAQTWPAFTRLGGLWRTEHPESKFEGPCHDQLCRERIVDAKKICRESRVQLSETLGGMGVFDEDGGEASDDVESLSNCPTPTSVSEDGEFPGQEEKPSERPDGNGHVTGEQTEAERDLAEMLGNVDLDAGRYTEDLVR